MSKCQFSENNNSSKFMKEHLNFKGHDLSSILNEKKQVIWQVVSSRLPPENITRMHRLITYKQSQTSVHYPYCLLLFGKVYMRENTFMSISDCHTLFSISMQEEQTSPRFHTYFHSIFVLECENCLPIWHGALSYPFSNN